MGITARRATHSSIALMTYQLTAKKPSVITFIEQTDDDDCFRKPYWENTGAIRAQATHLSLENLDGQLVRENDEKGKIFAIITKPVFLKSRCFL